MFIKKGKTTRLVDDAAQLVLEYSAPTCLFVIFLMAYQPSWVINAKSIFLEGQ